ncbi:hypothetical protein ACH3Y9_41105 [Streptomyces sp. WSLK1-5]|uniref:hypothetical protein n=1 Tax=unclassified Streptomyces TaxID=2593676 RepID=UPI0037A99193
MLLIAYVALLTIMVLLITIGGLGYAAHRYPALAQPLMVALTAAGVLIALLVGIAAVLAVPGVL